MLFEKLIHRVEALNLNLKGRVVLTEAASGPYVVTPILAALAGAEVYAYTQNSRYGSVREVVSTTKDVYADYTNSLKIEFIQNLSPQIISRADIITNSGHLRPLNKDKLQHAKEGVAIPLMYESWELRENDLDLKYIKQRGFKVGATNERHGKVDVFNYLGDMAIKQIFDAGLCLYNNTFILICNNDFGPYIAKVVSRLCKNLGVIDLPKNRQKYSSLNIDWLCDFPALEIPNQYVHAEAVIFTAYPFNDSWIGRDSIISIKELKKRLKHPFILRFAGDIDAKVLEAERCKYFPTYVPSGHMGILPSGIGYDPVIRLQAGGLKAGELMLSNALNEAESSILEFL